MSLTIPQSSAIHAAQNRNSPSAVIPVALFLALLAAELAVIIALAPSLDALRDLAPLG
jgi:hypothetical protein